MGQVYSFQDPLPIFLSDESDQGPCFDHDHEPDNEDYVAEDGWLDPGPCIICGTPHCACVGPTLE